MASAIINGVVLLAATLCLSGTFVASVGVDPIVVLEAGSLRGTPVQTELGRTVAAFTGIPYAKPPVGKHRFKESVPMGPWLGIYNATREANPCLQYSHLGFYMYGSEDCLYLNVFTPQIPTGAAAGKGAKTMDVIVYIHGGAFMFHSSREYGPKYLLDKDVVLVTLNYRLGPLGFLSTGDGIVPGNMGMKDQVLALKWVQRNIAAFGGNPRSITIAGMSAGGASVHYHMLSPLSAGLFHRAMSLSGTALNPWAHAENLTAKTHDLAAHLGCDFVDSDLLVKCLRSRPAEHIVAYSKYQQSWLYLPFSPWGPIVDPPGSINPFLPATPMEIIMSGGAADVPWINSYTSLEGLYPVADFVYNDELRSELDTTWETRLPDLLDYSYTADKSKYNEISKAIKEKYLGTKQPSDPNSIPGIIEMANDRLFVVGIVEAALAHAKKYKSPVYSYNFTFEGSDSVAFALCNCKLHLGGACHADDLGYILNAKVPLLSTPRDLAMSKKMVNLWVHFAATGVPKWEGLAEWPTVQSSMPEVALLEIDDEGKISKAFSDTKFWYSLGLNEDSLEAWNAQYRHTEL